MSTRVYISGRMHRVGVGELDADRATARSFIESLGSDHTAFAFEKLPEGRPVFPSDSEGEIARSQVFVLLLATSLSPRVVDELRFAQRCGLECHVLVKHGGERSAAASAFLKEAGCRVTPYGVGAFDLAAALTTVLGNRADGLRLVRPLTESLDKDWDRLIVELARDSERIFGLSPTAFEELLAELLSAFGYEVALTPRTGDGGKDIIARRGFDLVFPPTTYYVEAKLWRPDRRVGRPIIQRLFGAGKADSVDGVMLVTTSGFAATVLPFLQTNRLDHFVRLVDGSMLPNWYADYLGRRKVL